MARPLRLQFPGGTYHVTARGNDRRPVFEDDDDCARFLIVLAATVSRYHALCHAYCLMGNHYHLLLQTREANLSVAMRQLNGVYTQRFNRRHERRGHLWQGRFGAQVVDGEPYLREVFRYIVLNPVRAGLVAHPREWRWSSFCATAGEAAVPGFLTVDWVRALSGARTRGDAVKRYVSFVEAGIGAGETLLDRFRSKAVIGDAPLVGDVAEQCRDAVPCTEIPRAHRFAIRPGLAFLFAGVATRADRNARAAAAVRDHGYTMKEVAMFLGRHYMTVSRALAEVERGKPASEMLECET